MKIRLYVDEDSMRRALVVALESRGVDVQTALDAGMIARPDEAHLQLAATQGRVLYTFNIADFCRLHTDWLKEGRDHAGIIVAQQTQYSVGEQLRRLLRIISTRPAEEMTNHLEFLSQGNG